MKNRALSLLLALVMVCGLLPMTARAATLDNGLEYEVYADHVEITAYYGDAAEVVIPAKIKGLPVTNICAYAFIDGTNLHSIVIPDSITSVDNFAFYGCLSLTNIVIPKSVTSIGYYAFLACPSLNSIQVDKSNSNYSSDNHGVLFNKEKTHLLQAPGAIIGSYAIPASVTSISDFSFSYCANLTSIDVPDGITTIQTGTFRNSLNLASVNLPSTITSIGYVAFRDCTSLTSIKIPKNVTFIDALAFAGCTNLATIHFDGDAIEFGNNAFLDVTAIAYYPAENPTWTADVMQDYGGDITWIGYNPEGSFYDVQMGSWYEAPVEWAMENNITTGATADSFNPNGECLRAQVVTFLHRAAENPEPSSTNNPFSDVKSSDFFYKPVLWAVEKNITNGTSATKFGSYDVCNRAAVVTFLWRAAGSPEPESTDNPFVDVKGTDFYYKPVLWAIENGITNGVDATHFGPTTSCNRAQVVTFLYRAYN